MVVVAGMARREKCGGEERICGDGGKKGAEVDCFRFFVAVSVVVVVVY